MSSASIPNNRSPRILVGTADPANLPASSNRMARAGPVSLKNDLSPSPGRPFGRGFAYRVGEARSRSVARVFFGLPAPAGANGAPSAPAGTANTPARAAAHRLDRASHFGCALNERS